MAVMRARDACVSVQGLDRHDRIEAPSKSKGCSSSFVVLGIKDLRMKIPCKFALKNRREWQGNHCNAIGAHA